MKTSAFVPFVLLVICVLFPVAAIAQDSRFTVKVKDGTVDVKDFRMNAEKGSSSYSINGKYCDISFWVPDQSFAVTLNLPSKSSSPKIVQQQCEDFLLKSLAISQADACRLTLTMSAPKATNPYRSELWGSNMRLAFCESKPKMRLKTRKGDSQLSITGSKGGGCQTESGGFDALLDGRTIQINFMWTDLEVYRNGNKIAYDRQANILCPDVSGDYKIEGKQIEVVGKWGKPTEFWARAIYVP